MERHLAAILAADMVGYSRLMSADETGTLARQQAHLAEVIEPGIAEYRGRIFKTTGDGLLAEFPSVVDALRCAVNIQLAAAEREAEVPAATRIAYRVGINLGDIIGEGDDIFGDGVNIAARLEGLAEPGGICVSRTVFNQVKGKVASGFVDLGEHQVKNIPEPLHVFRVEMEPEAAGAVPGQAQRPATWKWIGAAGVAAVLAAATGLGFWFEPWRERVEPAAVERMAYPLPDKPSIAVLPFTNMSDDPAQEYFADGMTEDLITDLSKVSGLFVIARNSVFTYKGEAVEVLEGILNDETAAPKLRLDAAKTVLDRAGFIAPKAEERPPEGSARKSINSMSVAELEQFVANYAATHEAKAPEAGGNATEH